MYYIDVFYWKKQGSILQFFNMLAHSENFHPKDEYERWYSMTNEQVFKYKVSMCSVFAVHVRMCICALLEWITNFYSQTRPCTHVRTFYSFRNSPIIVLFILFYEYLSQKTYEGKILRSVNFIGFFLCTVNCGPV